MDTVNADEPIDQLLERGLDALDAGDRDAAQALLRRVLDQDPRNVQAWYAMAWTLPTARGVVWCLERVLALDPDHAEAAAYLYQARTSPGRFTARWLETDVKRLDETLGSVATLLSEAEQLADEVDRRLATLKRHGQTGSRLAGDDWAPELGALQRQLSPAEAVLARRQHADRDAEDLPSELYGELGRLWKSLLRQQRELRRHRRRIERIWDVVTGRERAAARVRRRYLPLVALALICLALLLLIASAVHAYPYVCSRLFSIGALDAASAPHRLTGQAVANRDVVFHPLYHAAIQSEISVYWPCLSHPTAEPHGSPSAAGQGSAPPACQHRGPHGRHRRALQLHPRPHTDPARDAAVCATPWSSSAQPVSDLTPSPTYYIIVRSAPRSSRIAMTRKGVARMAHRRADRTHTRHKGKRDVTSERRGTLIALVLGFVLGIIVVLICWRQREGRPPGRPGQDPEARRVTLPAGPCPVERPAGRSEPQEGPDDLTRVEGIGPGISSLLEAAGIDTYEQLAATDSEALRHILRDEGLHFADPDTWPEQAALAAVGAWSTLEELQQDLSRGRRIT